MSVGLGGKLVGKTVEISVRQGMEKHRHVGHGGLHGRERRGRHGSVVGERGLMVTQALSLVVGLCRRVVSRLGGLVGGMAKVLLSQLITLKSLRYQTGPFVRRVFARVMGRSYGSVALVARGEDAVALRQRDIGRVRDMLQRSCAGAREDRIRRAGLGASQV